MVTCRAIIKETMDHGLEIDSFASDKEKEKLTKAVWLQNYASCLERGAIETARAILLNGLLLMPQKKALWRKSIELEKESGTFQSLKQLLSMAVSNEKSNHEFLFIEYAKVLFKDTSDPDHTVKAVLALENGLSVYPASEDIAIALQEMLRQTG
jgi:hypothetical protein